MPPVSTRCPTSGASGPCAGKVPWRSFEPGVLAGGNKTARPGHFPA